MRRSKFVVLFLLIGFGCRQHSAERVYVDFEAVLASYKASPLPSRVLPKPPPGLPASTYALPSVAPSTIVVQGASSSSAQEILDKNRKKAIDELGDLLSQRYLREAERASADRIRALEPAKRAAMEKASTEAFAEFKAYADKRGYLLAQLTSIVGFPDPNPKSIAPPDSTQPFLKARLQRAADFRKQIADLDATYTDRVHELMAEAEREYNVQLALEQAQLDEDRQDALARATNEAMTEAAKAYKSIAPLILGATKVNLPGEPAQSVTLPAVPSPIAAPNVREKTLTLEQRRAILKSQLEMWLALNGYEQADKPDGVKDVTAAFEQWRADRKL
jgi:hypothetical protein